MVGPGRDQLVDIPRGDLVERREAAATPIVAIIFGAAGSGGRQEERQHEAGEPAQSADAQV